MKAVPGKRYKHYKGKEYTVLHLARHSETLEELVVYRAEYFAEDVGQGAIWVRPKKMFEEQIEVDGKTVERFKEVT